MRKTYLLILIIGLCTVVSCKNHTKSQLTEEGTWKLGWRLIENSMDEKLVVAELQFDTLLRMTDIIDRKFLVTGLEVKSKLHKNEEVTKILYNQSVDMRIQLCTKDFLKNLSPCNGLSEEKIKNKDLQMELIRMYIDDQASRGNIMEDIISKFDINRNETTQDGAIIVDERNRTRLKEIFVDNGFPTRELVGKDAMYGIFLMLQHSDGDKDWQKSQLPNIERAVKAGDLNGQSFAYLYDRIRINGGEKQLYGSQFSNVDPVAKTVELAATEDLSNLNKRRREMGMMPIEMYKRFMLKNL